MAITNAEHRRFMAVRDEFLKTLREAGRRRGAREEIDVNGEPAWVGYERRMMYLAVNRRRRDSGLPLIKLDEVVRVERQACGHIDYAEKFALGCAELACGIGRKD